MSDGLGKTGRGQSMDLVWRMNSILEVMDFKHGDIKFVSWDGVDNARVAYPTLVHRELDSLRGVLMLCCKAPA